MGREVQSPRQFFAVPIQRFRDTTRAIPFDVYLHISGEHYAHVFSKTTGLDYKRLIQFSNRGVQSLYVREADRALFEQYVGVSALAALDRPGEPLEKKITALLNVTEQNLSEIFFLAPLRADSVARTREVVKRYVNLMAGSPMTLAKILSLVSRGDYLYFHSIAVSVFSLFVANATGKLKPQEIERVGLGAFLHDLGFSRLPRDVTEYAEEIEVRPSPAIQAHVTFGTAMLEEAGERDDSLLKIVAHHHERPDGLGYPHGVRGEEIELGARIVAAADSFSTLISHRTSRGALSPGEAIARMRSDPGRFDPEVLGALERVFARAAKIAA